MTAIRLVLLVVFALVAAILVSKFAWFVLEESTAKVSAALHIEEK